MTFALYIHKLQFHYDHVRKEGKFILDVLHILVYSYHTEHLYYKYVSLSTVSRSIKDAGYIYTKVSVVLAIVAWFPWQR